VPPEIRELDATGEVRIGAAVSHTAASHRDARDRAGPETGAAGTRERRIYPFGVSRQRLAQALRETRFPAQIVDHLDDADVVITIRPYYRRKPQTLHDAEARGIPIYVVKSNTTIQLEQVLLTMRSDRTGDPVMAALKEAEDAIGQVINVENAVDLNPQNAYVRRLQHMLAQRYNLASRSLGKEPHRYVRIMPGDSD
jgi:R3H domain-containing protein